MQASLPPDEAERLKALRRYEILDTAPETEFDDITLLASHICGTPISLITLLDENRQWFKSKVGLSVSETAREVAFCAHAILETGVLVVDDAEADQRFASNPLVTGNTKIRFYAGSPLITSDGHALGTLCVIDQVPRELSEAQKTALQALGRQVVAQLELRHSLNELRKTAIQLYAAKKELTEKTAFLEAQVDSSLDGILVVDPQGKRILQNQRLVALLKIPPHVTDDTEHQKQIRWVADLTNDPERFVEKVAYLYAHPDEVSRDEVELKDGTVLDRSSAPVIGKDGKLYGRTWTYHDITESKRLEGQLVQSQKMESVGQLAGGIAHEFNSILTAIIGQSELLLGELPIWSPLAKNVTEINKAAARAAMLTRQLLAYGRKQFLQPEALDLNRVITSTEGMFRPLMGGDVTTVLVPAFDLQAVKADLGQLEQVIMNMAINSRHAMPKGGTFTLETANVSFDQESRDRAPELKPGDYVMLAITDTGVGMSTEVRERVFEPFFTTKGVGQGTGLGLSTCYGIIKQSGGHISVQSELERGTTFKIYLPQVECQAKTFSQRVDSPDLPRGTETILLVEDDPALREMATSLLERLGYTVFPAANGIEALNLKQQHAIGHIDLLFTDILMPLMSGKELSERVRALYPHTKILFTSTYTEKVIVHEGGLKHGVAHLQKPFTPSALARKLRETLD